MTPEPAPYGADLPIIARLRDEQVEFWYGGEPTVGPMLAALDAANAEVLALREVVEAVRDTCLAMARWEPASRRSDHIDGMGDAGLRILALLPAPTEEEQRG